MSRGVTVVKVGGNEVEDSEWLAALAAGLRTHGPVVLVHGGGREVSALQRHFGAEPEWRDGLRVSSAQTVSLASMVLSGLVNKRIVASLLNAGIDAVGLSGEDGGLLLAEPAQQGALGRTGTVLAVRTSLLESLLGLGLCPVLSPVSRGVDGSPLNVNADDAACAIALALEAERLLYVSNVAGVALEGGTVADIAIDQIGNAVESGLVTGGMVPKLKAAARAASGGVADVRIGALDMLSGANATRVSASVAVLA